MTARPSDQSHAPTRRSVIAGASAAAIAVTLVRPARATPAEMQAAIARLTGGRPLQPGRVKLDIPPLVENGNTVPCTVTVESPMTAADHVKAIHLFNEKNPQPNVISVHLGPRAGLARIATE